MARQTFREPMLRIYENGNEKIIKIRNWTISDEFSTDSTVGENMGELGRYPIVEAWKHYSSYSKGEIFVSNLGYVAEMSIETFEEVFGKKLSEFGEGRGFFEFRDLTKEQKDIIRKSNFVPKNKENSGLQIWLYVEQLGFTRGQIHRMVAEMFLEHPIGESKNGWVVHHIDNNSYNNSVTNLIYLKKVEEHSAFSRQLHRPSFN